jgi:hypothetical protein
MKQIAESLGWYFVRICATCSMVRKEVYKNDAYPKLELWVVQSRNIFEIKQQNHTISNGTSQSLETKLKQL